MTHLMIAYSKRPTTYKNHSMSAIQIKGSLSTKKYGAKFKFIYKIQIVVANGWFVQINNS